MIGDVSERLGAIIALGGPVVAILVGFSVLSMACILWKAAVFAKEGIGGSVTRGFSREALAQVRAARSAGAGCEELRLRAQAHLDVGFARVGAGLRLLDVIAQVAPLLGLFGTVLGMIDAFRTLQEAGGTADPAILAGGIWVALVTTAAGLVVAMPTSMALSWFDARIDRHERAVMDALEEMFTPDVFARRDAAQPQAGQAAHA